MRITNILRNSASSKQLKQMEPANIEAVLFHETNNNVFSFNNSLTGETSEGANGSDKEGNHTGDAATGGEVGLMNDFLFSFSGIFFQMFYLTHFRPKEWTKKLVYGYKVTEIVECLWKIAIA